VSCDIPTRHRRQLIVHSVRVLLFMSTIGLIRLQYIKVTANEGTTASVTADLNTLRKHLPDAVALADALLPDGSRQVLDADSKSIGRILQTSPSSDHITGFSGPTNTLVVLDSAERIASIDIVSSGDTPEHVASVMRDKTFLNSFAGLPPHQTAALSKIDAVSGATLTCLAIQESVIHRLTGQQHSLRFPECLTPEDARPLFPNAHTVQPPENDSIYWQVINKSGQLIGRILRTSPVSDSIVGYQGPTDTLIALDSDDNVAGIAVSRSYDNEPYIRWIREDTYFLALFNDLTLNRLAEPDAEMDQVEGVSGATMTSMAIVQSLVAAAKQHQQSEAQQSTQRRTAIHWTMGDAGTAVVVLFGLVVSLTSLRLSTAGRTVFQIVLVGYLGLINGDLVSQAMLVGWAQSGVPWRHAAGLLVLTLAAVCIPVTAGRNVYCNHLCPHGAAQQLLRNRLPWRLKLHKGIARTLRTIPLFLLAWCVLVAMTHIPFSLAGIEAFDAWIFRVAGWASIMIAVAGLVASMFVPMAYCRFGCPTGSVLNYLRLNGRSNHWSQRDWFAVALVVLALTIYVGD